MKELSYCVYRFTFSDGKIYIGFTSNPKQRHSSNAKYADQTEVYNAIIADGGIRKIKIDILETGLTKTEAQIKERELISKYNSSNPEFGYNRNDGEFQQTGISKKERMHLYYLKNKDKIYTQNEKNRKANMERVRERSRINYWKDVEHSRARNRASAQLRRDAWTPEEREEANRKQREYKHSKRDYPTRKPFNK